MHCKYIYEISHITFKNQAKNFENQAVLHLRWNKKNACTFCKNHAGIKSY